MARPVIEEIPPAPRIGGRYELQALIGRGGAGTVHRALDLRLDRVVAIKVLRSDPDESELLRRRSEAQLLASLSHPSLVTLYDAIATPDATYLVMEHLGGGTLQGRIRHGALDADAVTAIAADLADALAYIHQRGIVHRDVKPGNVLLAEADPEGRPPTAKLSDFGIAKLLETSPGTSTGVLGTAHYLSPEQARGVPVGPASDVYSLGLTLLEAATGRTAFPGTAVESLTARLLRDPEVPGSLGYGWRSLLTAMTAREPEARPTAVDVAVRARSLAAEAVADGWDADVTAPIALAARTEVLEAPPRPATGPLRPRRLVIAVGAVALVAGLAIALPAVLSGVPGAGGAAPARSGPQTVPTSASSSSSARASASAPVRSPSAGATAGSPSASSSGGGAATPAAAGTSTGTPASAGKGKGKGEQKGKDKSGSSGKGSGGGNGKKG